LEADNYLVFYSDASLFAAQFPDVTNKVGPINFNYDGNGDVILIYDANGIIYQSVGFDDMSPYPLSPDGGGTALQIVDAAANINFASNWKESCPEGTPAAAYVLPCANSIDESLPQSIALYPNPVSKQLTVDLPEGLNENISYSIYDITGKQVLYVESLSANTLKINVAALYPGMYFLQINFDENSYAGSFIKE
jgi:hypothetical protein